MTALRTHGRPALLAVTALAILTMLPGCRSGSLELDGSWFVRYHSDPKPYLDVAFRGPRPQSVSVVLSGPQGFEETLPLSWNRADGEWQVVPTHLPDPLPGGTWWVSSVRAVTSDEVWTWGAARPASPYALTRGDTAATVTTVTPGFFSSPLPGAHRVRIETLGPPTGQRADPILAVFAEGESTHWLAALDDYDVAEPYPTLVVPVTPGTPYFVRITGAEDDGGHYAIRVVPESMPRMAPPQTVGTIPDAHEPDESPDAATELSLGQTLHRSLGARDVDWMRFVVPTPSVRPPGPAPTPAPTPATPGVRTPPAE